MKAVIEKVPNVWFIPVSVMTWDIEYAYCTQRGNNKFKNARIIGIDKDNAVDNFYEFIEENNYNHPNKKMLKVNILSIKRAGEMQICFQ